MTRTLLVQVVTPETTLFNGEVEMVVATTNRGEMGILPLHAPIVAELAPGEIRLKRGPEADQTLVYSVYGGYIQCAEDRMIILAEGAIDLSSVDTSGLTAEIEAIKAKVAEAQESAESDEDEVAELNRELVWAEHALAVGSRRHK